MTKKNNEKINNPESKILFMEPVFKQRIWGGDHLRKEFGYNIPSDNTGECWGIAAHDNGSSVVKNGKYKGKTLKELFEEKPELFGNIEDDRFPLLVKILYAKEDSSIQVHPDDDYAIKNENGSLGKSECWYILDCDDNAEIMLGHNAKTREELKEMIEGGKWDAFISKVPIKKGDLIQIDPGTVHTITGGLMILEIQQNSDVTYRVYDYDRLQSGKPRELHIKESIDVITVPEKDKSSIIRNYNDIKENEMVEIASCNHYTVWKIKVTDTMEVVQDKAFMNMSVIDGEGWVDDLPVKKGDHFVLPSGINPVMLSGNMTIIASAK